MSFKDEEEKKNNEEEETKEEELEPQCGKNIVLILFRLVFNPVNCALHTFCVPFQTYIFVSIPFNTTVNNLEA